MPTYQYCCGNCRAVWEMDHPASECGVVRYCEKCNTKAERIITTPPTTIYKGGGWYKDGYQKSVTPSKGGERP